MEKRVVTVTCHPSGKIDIEALSLTDDLWQDYEFFLKSSEQNFRENKTREMNRELRAGLLCLFAHLEGVVNYLYDIKPELSTNSQGESLCNRTINIGSIVKKEGGRLPYINLKEGKGLRNIIVHPDGNDRRENPIDSRQVFDELNCENLKEVGDIIKRWLDAVCDHFGTTRMMDTKKHVEDLAEGLSGNRTSNEI